MIVKPETYKKLIAISKGRIHSINNKILRKTPSRIEQKRNLTENSVCIVCDYRFLVEKIKWASKVKAICHPFHDTSIFPDNIKTYLFSESDFCSSLLTPTKERKSKWDDRNYDFVYFTLLSRQGIHCKGLYMLTVIDRIAGELGLRGLVINYSDYQTKKHDDKLHNRALEKIKSNWKKFPNLKMISKSFSINEVCSIMLGCKSVLFPNEADASPRILAEAIVRGRPVIVNSSIYGGWKYVNDVTGRFFNVPSLKEYSSHNYDVKAVEDSLRNAMSESLLLDTSLIAPEFEKEWGFANSCRKLASIINSVSGTNYEFVAFKEWKQQMKTLI